MPLPRLATDEQLERILDAAITTLETAGFLVQDDGVRGAMLGAGCTEATHPQAVLIPHALVEEMLAPRRADPAPKPDGPTRVDWDPRPGLGGQLAQFYLDHPTRRRLPGSRELLAELTRFAHVWSEGAGGGPVLLCRDVPPPVEPMEAALTIARNAGRVACAYPHTASQVPYLADLGAVLNDDPNSLIGACLFTVSPLRMDRRAGALMVELVRRKAPVWVGTQPVAGASAPVTVAGTVVIGVAEILAGWTAAYALDPEIMPGAGICSGTLDMRTADVSFCAPESMLQDLLCVELFRELCGGRCGVAGSADYTDAKWPGLQKAFEAAFEGLTMWMYAGSAPFFGSGMLESGKTFSPVQFMLDCDLARYVGRFARGVDVGEADLALDEILDVGLGFEGAHLGTDHTLTRFRALFDPRLLDRSCWRGDEAEAGSEASLLDRAWEAYQSVLARYEPVSVGEDKLRDAEGIVARACSDLCGTVRPEDTR